MSTIEVNKITPVDGGTNTTLGDSGDTFQVPSGVTLDIASGATLDATGATVSGITSTTINNNADNRVITGSDTANTLEGESSLIFSGDALTFTYATNPVIDVIDSTNTVKARHQAGNTAAIFGSASNHPVVFIQGSGEAERMNIDTSGRVNINTASAITGEGVLQVSGNSSQNLSAWRVATNGNVGLRFFNSSTQGVGDITINASGTAFNTSSDYRLKENESLISDGITRLKTLKPYRFNFKTEPDKTVDGFFAHEVTAVPEAITGTKDATETLQKVILDSSGSVVAFNVEQSKWTQGKTDGEYANNTTWEASKEIIKSQSIDQSKLVPLLTSALQEAITKIETLETKVAALESA